MSEANGAPGQSDGVYGTGRARAVVIADAVFMALATAAIVARIASRRLKRVTTVVDDLILAVGLVCDLIPAVVARFRSASTIC